VLPETIPNDIRIQVTSFMPLASIAVSLILVSIMVAYVSAATVVILGFVCSTAVGLAYFYGLPVAYFAIGLFAVLGLIQGGSFALVPELNVTPQDRALANGAMAQTGNLGNLIGTPILLAVLGYGGQSAMIMLVVGLYIIGGLLHVFLRSARLRA